MSFFQYILNIVIVLPIILGLFLVVLKTFNNCKVLDKNSNYIRVLEKEYIGKDTYSLVLRAGEEGFIVISSGSNFEVLKTISSDELAKIEENLHKKQFNLEEKDIFKRLSNFKKDNKHKFARRTKPWK